VKSDALAVLRSQTPAKVWAFAEAWAADPDLRPGNAANAIGELSPTEFLRDPRTHRAMSAILATDRDALQDTRRAGIMMLSALCGYDPAEAFDRFGEALNIHDMPPEVRSAIVAYEKRSDGSVKIRFSSRIDALRLLFAHFGDLPPEGVTVNAAAGATVVFRGRG
jgi:hypothetical protein